MESCSEQSPPEGRPGSSRPAEDRVFDANEGSDQPGIANHEEKTDPEAPEMDFIISLPGVGRFGLQVKDFY